jgi:hypothetical protein
MLLHRFTILARRSLSGVEGWFRLRSTSGDLALLWTRLKGMVLVVTLMQLEGLLKVVTRPKKSLHIFDLFSFYFLFFNPLPAEWSVA